ncbi:MAG: heat-inducible transcription repressor HrcA [Armatimonadetes bacterium]|nr:heat-inducible transcription repressor HrcA [Armatimonadota bacterium]
MDDVRTRTYAPPSFASRGTRAPFVSAAPGPSAAALDARKRVLLEALIHQHVQSAEPVPSEWLATTLALGVRAATIRNELAAMTDLGYLRQPHTSAGRVPSDQGYRYFVDFLMRVVPLASAERRQMQGLCLLSDGDVERLLLQTCRVLSSLTRYTSMAVAPTGERPRIRQIHLVQMASRRLLVVAVLDTGQVVHRFVELVQDLTPAEVDRLGNALVEMLAGQEVGQAIVPDDVADALAPYHPMLRRLGEVVQSSTEEESREPLYCEGTARMLEHPEFRSAARLEPLIRFLEERRGVMIEQLRILLRQAPTTVVIGEENPHPDLHDCSFVSARYEAGDRLHGWVGVVGPTRMDYERALPAVQSAAAVLTQVFTRLSAG